MAKIKATRLASGLVPPTNRWFSGLVFGDQPQPVFPMPLSVKLTDTGIGARAAAGQRLRQDHHGRDQTRSPAAAGGDLDAGHRYDTLTVTAAYFDAAGIEQGSVVLAQGSPFVTYTAAVDQNIAIEPIFTGAGPAVATVAGQEYGLVVERGSDAGERRGHLAQGRQRHPVRGAVRRRRRLAGHGGGEPGGGWIRELRDRRRRGSHHAELQDRERRDHRDRDRWPVRRWSTPRPRRAATPPSTARCRCTRVLRSPLAPLAQPSGRARPDRAVAARTRPPWSPRSARTPPRSTSRPTDTYFGGKYLYRGANLMTLAEQLGVTDVATTLRTRLTAELKHVVRPEGLRRAARASASSTTRRPSR